MFIVPFPTKLGTNRIVIPAVCSMLILLTTLSTFSQKPPIAMRKNSPLSPLNVSNYTRLANDYETSVDNGDLSKALQLRNRLIFLVIANTDTNFHNFEKGKRRGNALLQTLLDFFAAGASTAISLTNGSRPKTVIGEALTLFQATRNSYNKNFKILEMPTLFNKMQALRAEAKERLLTKSTLYDVREYPFEAALVDLVNYYRAGTIDGALSALSIDTGVEANQAQESVESLDIASPEQVDQSLLLRQRIAELFLNIETKNVKATESFNKLREGLKSISDIDPEDIKPSELDKLNPSAQTDVTTLKTVYAKVRIKLLKERGGVQRLIDALK
jgi:hypothetical protein